MRPLIALSDKQLGHQNAICALAMQLGLDYEMRIPHIGNNERLTPLWAMKLNANTNYYNMLALQDFAMPPRLILSIGSKTAKAALWLQHKTKARAVHILSPNGYDKNFDMVIRPHHDKKNSHKKNVHYITGSFSRWNANILAQQKKEFAYIFNEYTSPSLGVLIGGNTKDAPFTMDNARQLLRLILRLSAGNITILMTASPRTPKNIRDFLHQNTHNVPRIYFWQGAGDNPYGGILAYSDAFLVSADSVSMVSEAIQTQKPTYIFNSPLHDSKISRFINEITTKNYAQILVGDDIDFAPPTHKLDNMAELYPKLRKLLAKIPKNAI